MKRLLISAVLAALVSGCGGQPRIDTTTDGTTKASIKAVADSLSSGDKAKFQGQLMGAMMRGGLKKFGLTKGGKLTLRETITSWNGMTGREVIEMTASK